MMRCFSGDVILITGGSSGIGLAAARLFLAGGARVYLLARQGPRLEAAVNELGPEVFALPADLADPTAVTAAVQALGREEGRLDLLLNCGGQLEIGPASELGPEVAEHLMRVNYLGAVRTIAACLPLLCAGRRRSIVNVSSVAGRMAPPWMAAYAASKFALTAYTLALRQELRQEHFHVGLVYPGPVATAMTEGRIGGPHYPVPRGIPVIGPEQVAEAIAAMVRRRRLEVTVPRGLGIGTRLLAAWPLLTDWVYRGRMRQLDTLKKPSSRLPQPR